MYTAIIAVCAWISVPLAVPFTLQTFGVFCALFMLGGKRGTIAVAVYILLGAVGVPVFSGFTGGIGRLFDATGGFIWGFLLCGVVYWSLEKWIKFKVAAMAVGAVCCYALGTVWYGALFAKINVVEAVSVCVLPFVIPEAIKLFLAITVAKMVEKIEKSKNSKKI